MTPRRLGFLIATLLILSSSLAISIVRYPDLESGLTVAEAQALNDDVREGRAAGSFADCSASAPDPERPCEVAHVHNWIMRTRLMGVTIGLAVVLSALGFRRRFDLPAAPQLDRVHG